MTRANPYHAFLNGRDPLEVMRETPRKLREMGEELGASGMERSLEPGKWPARSILSHLADCELAFGYRLRQALTVDNYQMQPFDQEKWAQSYGVTSGPHAIEVFTSVRGWNLALLKTLGPQQMAIMMSHPQRGELTLRILLETVAGHDINHLSQLEQIRGR